MENYFKEYPRFLEKSKAERPSKSFLEIQCQKKLNEKRGIEQQDKYGNTDLYVAHVAQVLFRSVGN